jgi:O-antigen/teichoic acid export membrane protein
LSTLRNKTLKAFSWDVLGKMMNQGSTFVVSIFLARLLDPEDFGLVAMAMAFISIATVFIDVGFSAALIQSDSNTDKTYSSIFIFNIIAGATLTIITFFAAPLIGGFYNSPEVTNLTRWLSLMFLFNSFNRVQNAILNKNLEIKKQTVRSFSASIISGILGVMAAFYGLGVYSLVVQTLSFAVIGTVMLWSTTEWRPSFYFSYSEVKKLMGFSIYAFFERVLNNIFIRLDVLLLAKLFSPLTVSFYTRASTLKDFVTKYSSSSIIRVLFPILSQLKNDHKAYENVYFRMFSIIALLSYLLTGVLYFMGADLIPLLFGKKWTATIPIFQILILSSCNIPLNSLMWNAMMSKGKAKENFYFSNFKKIIGLFPFGFAYYYNDIWWFTVTWVISNFLVTILNVFMLKTHSNLSMRRHFYELFMGFVPLVPAILFFEWLELIQFSTKLGYSVVFILVFLAFSLLTRNQGLLYVMSTTKDLQNTFKNKLLKKI